jgi:glycosyltransferase involved in cell wall biosynthesis
MRIALVAAGGVPIPPRSWGAVEGTIWHRKQWLERHGHTVDVYNSFMVHEVVHALNARPYDFVHCHTELFVLPLNAHLRHSYALTSHFGGLHRFVPGGPDYPAFEYLFRDSLTAPANIVLSERVRDLYLGSGYRGFLRVLRNAVETDAFRLADRGNGKAICVGMISTRKRQAWLADAAAGRVEVDFVGPWDARGEPGFNPRETVRHLGVWDKATLYEHLTDYSCLVLLSDSEGAPKVVLEALAAGLNVVITAACAANLTPEPFITVLPEDELQPDAVIEAIDAAIAANDAMRPAIRAYAAARFDYDVVTPEYLEIIHDYCASGCPR